MLAVQYLATVESNIVIQLRILKVLAQRCLKKVVTRNTVQMQLKHVKRTLKNMVSNHVVDRAVKLIIATVATVAEVSWRQRFLSVSWSLWDTS